MDLNRHLEFFLAVAAERHFSRAADRLGITQPPLSQGIQRLEEHLGLTLIHRTSRSVALTERGQALVPFAEESRAAAARFVAEAEQLRTRRRTATIGLAGSLASELTATIISTAAGLLTDVRIATTHGTTTSLVRDVAAGSVSCAFVVHPAALGDLVGSPIARFRRDAIVPAGTHLGDEVDLRELRHLSFATYPRSGNPPGFDLDADTLNRLGGTTSILQHTTVRESIEAVASGHAFTVIPAAMRTPTPLGRVALRDDPLPLRIRAIWRPDCAPPIPQMCLSLIEKLTDVGQHEQ